MQPEVSLKSKQQQQQQQRQQLQQQPNRVSAQFTPLPITILQQPIPVQLWKINQKMLKSDTNRQQNQQQQQRKQKYQQEQPQHFATIRRVPSPHYSGRCQ